MSDIDFVLTYLDANDPQWQEEKNRYTPGAASDVATCRYREWDNLHFFFRGVERFAPWVRKIHFVTWGHVPAWLNTDHPKINIVNHRDYLPGEWLPTFSSRCIDMNLHRIPGLAEQFVYFNDDMFLTSETEPEFFFRKGLPCDAAVMSPAVQTFKLGNRSKMYFAPYMDMGVINKYFNKKEVIRKNPAKWINPRYGSELVKTFTMLPYPSFICFRNFHLPYGYLKSTYEKVWELEPEYLGGACSHRFREMNDPNHFLFTYWQYVTGNFCPRSTGYGKCFQLHSLKDAEAAERMMRRNKYKMVCLNDAVEDEGEFERIRKIVEDALTAILPERSSFERQV